MPDLALISKAVDYIEDHLQSAITVADMAGAVSFSLYHFCRIFNQSSHHTPYDYLMRRRLAEAARALLRTDDRILDIALDYQFNSPETFSRAFKRVFGLQPSQWRKQGRLDRWRLMPRLTLAHLQHLHKGAYLKPIEQEREPFQLAGLMTLVQPALEQPAEAIAELWSLAARELAHPEAGSIGGRYYGLACYQEGWEERGFLYTAGSALDPSAPSGAQAVAHSALVVKSIPGLVFARFVHKGRRRDLPLTLDYIYHTWLPKSGRTLALPWVLEAYGPELPSAESDDAEMAILVPLDRV
ncbi:MAG: AraC family transcriptional regulator [Anaerolineae bacterium]|jgi:AraC family transcriptional regulator